MYLHCNNFRWLTSECALGISIQIREWRAQGKFCKSGRNLNNLGIQRRLPELYAFPSLPNEYSKEDAQSRERENEHILSFSLSSASKSRAFFLLGIGAGAVRFPPLESTRYVSVCFHRITYNLTTRVNIRDTPSVRPPSPPTRTSLIPWWPASPFLAQPWIKKLAHSTRRVSVKYCGENHVEYRDNRMFWQFFH